MEQITPFLLPGAIAFATIAVFISQIIKGKNDNRTVGEQVSSEVINAFKVQVDQLKAMRTEDKATFDAQVINFTNQVSSLNKEIGNLNGMLSEKDKQIDKYEKIFQNRDPELLKLLQDIKTFMGDLHKVVLQVDDRTKKSEERNLKIDKGHIAAAKVIVEEGK